MTKFHRITVIVSIVVALAIHQNAKAQNDVDLPLDKLLSTKISTAAKHDQQMSEVAASVTVISSEEIQRYGWTSFDELLNAIRGLYITNDRNFSSLGVRGISRPTDSNSRLLVLLDGNPLVGAAWGESPTGNMLSIDLNSIERVEFVRGPGSALYGTGAMFGVLNVITRKANEIAGFSGNIGFGSGDRHSASVRFGKTFASGVAVAANVNWSDAKGLNLYYPEFDSPQTNNGVADGRDFERFGAAMATLTWGPLKVWGRTQMRQKGIPTASYGTVFNELSQTKQQSQVVGADYTACGRCWWCERQEHWHCPQRRFFGTGPAFGSVLEGAQAELVRVPHADVVLRRVPAGVSLDAAVFLGDTLATGYAAVQRAGYQPGDTVVVIGGGPVGQLTSLVAQACAAGPVVLVEPVSARRDLAAANGSVTVDPPAARAAVDELTDGRGADAVVDAVGGALGLDAALGLVRAGGTVVSVGLHTSEAWPLPAARAFTAELTLRFAIGDFMRDAPQLGALLRAGVVDPAVVASERVSLDDVPAAYQRMAQRLTLKTLVCT